MSVGEHFEGNDIFRVLTPKKQSCSWCGQESQSVTWTESGSYRKYLVLRRARKKHFLTNNMYIIMGLCYRLPSQANDTDKLFFEELRDSSKS